MRQLVIILLLFTACNDNKPVSQQPPGDSPTSIPKGTTADTPDSKNIWVDRLNGKKYLLPDSIAGQPVSFYLDNSKVAPITKAFYKGQFRPTDNDSTTQLLSYVTTDDSIIRPFYRWCLDFTISISDGALGEYPGSPALAYATKFPKEFFAYMDKDLSRQRYSQWTEIIAYSGINDYNKKETEIEKDIIDKMNSNCADCGDDTRNHIKAFANDIVKAVKLQD
jgi:hypothetical protein